MKLRISEHGLRFRLGKSEVHRLGRGEALEHTLTFLPRSLTCRLEPAAENTATFDGSLLRVCVNRRQACQWSQTDAVSLAATVAGTDLPPIEILVEKDFKCLHGDVSGQEDCFPNPTAAS